MPEVTHGCPLMEVIGRLSGGGARVALDNYEASIPLSQHTGAADHPANSGCSSVVVLAVGPERGWSAAERGLLRGAGFDKAFWTIMDSNVTTLIAALFLAQLGSGPIQGFAISLSIGTISSLFTALFVSHLLYDFETDVLKVKHVSISWRIK